MRILITHVTRMARGYCCVAGITEAAHQHLRPALGGSRLSTGILAPNGPFDMGAIVELGKVHPAGHTPPEVEDHLFDPARAKRAGYIAAARLWEILQATAAASIHDAFGPELEHHGERASVAVLGGRASLAVYRPLAGCQLTVRQRDGQSSLRLRLPAEGLDLSLTDARYYTDELQRPHEARLKAAREELDAGRDVLLGLGLTRPFKSHELLPERHWLQVTALHLGSNPGLRLE